MLNNPKLDTVNINAEINFVKFCQFVLKLLSGNEILTSTTRSRDNTTKPLRSQIDDYI